MAISIEAPNRSVMVDGLRIAYRDASSDRAATGSPAVLLIHGAFEDGSYFAPQIEHLAPGRRVIALDLRGHGASDATDRLSIDRFACDALAVCDDAGLAEVVVCGHSLIGGAIACAMAVARPDLVRGVAVLDAIAFAPVQWRVGVENLVAALDGDQRLDALRGYFSRTFDTDDPPALWARVMADLGRVRPEIAQAVLGTFLAADPGPAMETVPSPLLYIHAKAPADLTRLAAVRPDAWIGQVVGSGHYLTLSVPDQVNAMLDRFLDAIESRSERDNL
jgi:pimeloyl-ACP methyl ester carboxylesterase